MTSALLATLGGGSSSDKATPSLVLGTIESAGAFSVLVDGASTAITAKGAQGLALYDGARVVAARIGRTLYLLSVVE